jgi:hypothetical protein
MATTLQSPGVSVSIINESFYTPGAPGTVPVIFVASAQDKTNPSGTVAVGTKAANAGKVYLVTSQRDLTDTFGTPLFYTDNNGNPVHGGELNEYGLQAAYSLLGVSSAAYIVRAPADLASLVAKDTAPSGAPADGSYWLDTANSLYGIFEWDQAAGTFANKVPKIIDDLNASANYDSDMMTPKAGYGTVGQYVAVLNQPSTETHIFYKNVDANWVEVGSEGETNFTNNGANNTFVSTVWSTSIPAVKGSKSPAAVTQTGRITINTATITVSAGTVADIASSINAVLHTSGVGAKVVKGALAIYVDSATTSSVTITSTATALLAQLGLATGGYNAPTVFVGPHTQYPNFSTEPSGSVYLKTTSPNYGANWVIKQWSSTSNAFNRVKSPIYATSREATYNLDKTGGGANIPVGTLYIESNYDQGNHITGPVLAEFQVLRRTAVAPTRITTTVSSSTVSIATATMTIKVTEPGSSAYLNTTTITVSGGLDAVVQAINASGVLNLSAVSNTDGTISILHETGGEIKFIDPSDVLGQAGFAMDTATSNLYSAGAYNVDPNSSHASNWKPLKLTASSVQPTAVPENGTLWYDSIMDQVDVMYHNGTTWVGYLNAFPATDPKGPIVSATKPTKQSDGVTALANGDIWVSLANGSEMYGQEIYVYDGNALQWVLQDTTDQTSPTGWLFADARWATTGQATTASPIVDLLASNYLDPDAPDPTEYPRGMRLWNLRRSGFNIKKYVKNYININANNGQNIRYQADLLADYNPDRWISVSPNNADGSGTFGRHAQRAYVVSSLKALIDGNTAIRDTDTLTFNLITTPGYPEAIANMVTLNADRAYTAFVIGDTSFRLKPTATDLAAYGLNSNGAFDNGEKGLVSYNEYMAVFYPSGYTNDLTGNYIVVPPSHMMLRTMVSSDQKSYPWFAPAGIRRGVVDNATSVGYIENGEFKSTALPQGIRDVMAQKGHINPIATITGAGIINFGQYTRANAASSLDRINVARLVAHLRRQLDVLARPYLFEPNDKITRSEIKNAVQSLLLELVGQRALYDFIVVCDESNNTPARIDRSELWVDVAIEPVKAVEFIYIPVRLVNTGAIKAGTFTLA